MKKITLIFTLCFCWFFAFSQSSNNPRPLILSGVFDKSVFDLYYQNQLFRNTFATVKDGADTVVYFVDINGIRKQLKGSGSGSGGSVFANDGNTLNGDTVQFGSLYNGGAMTKYNILNKSRSFTWADNWPTFGESGAMVFNNRQDFNTFCLVTAKKKSQLDSVVIGWRKPGSNSMTCNRYGFWMEHNADVDASQSMFKAGDETCVQYVYSNNLLKGSQVTLYGNHYEVNVSNNIVNFRPDSTGIQKRFSYQSDLSSTLTGNSLITPNYLFSRFQQGTFQADVLSYEPTQKKYVAVPANRSTIAVSTGLVIPGESITEIFCSPAVTGTIQINYTPNAAQSDPYTTVRYLHNYGAGTVTVNTNQSFSFRSKTGVDTATFTLASGETARIVWISTANVWYYDKH